jgi:hypothetical protein
MCSTCGDTSSRFQSEGPVRNVGAERVKCSVPVRTEVGGWPVRVMVALTGMGVAPDRDRSTSTM